MTTIQLYCRGVSAWTKVSGRITKGMVGLNVTLCCDKSWAGLTRSLVARNGDGERWVLAAVGDTAVVPHEALKEEGHLYLCLEGRDADGHLVLPSNWASCGRIYDSGGGKPGTAEATPTELQQLMVLADQARRTAEEALRRSGQGGGSPQGGVTEDWVKEQGYLKESALSDAVDDALEKAKTSGAFDGVTPNLQIGEVTTLEAGASATAAITGTKENPRLNLGIPKGQQGAPGNGSNIDLSAYASKTEVQAVQTTAEEALRKAEQAVTDGAEADKNPTVVKTWKNTTAEAETSGDSSRVNFLYASGNRLYVGGYNGRLKRYDISDKANPWIAEDKVISIVQNLICTGIAEFGEYIISTWRSNAAGVTLASGTNGAVLISNRSTLETVDSIAYTDRKCARVAIDEDVCVVSCMKFGFLVFQVVNGRPELAYAHFQSGGIPQEDFQGSHIFWHGGRRYCAFAGFSNFIRIYDITTPAAPFQVWSMNFGSFSAISGKFHTYDVRVEYPKIYATAGQTADNYGAAPDLHGILWADISRIDGITSAPSTIPGPGSGEWGYVNFPLELMNRGDAWAGDTMPTRMEKIGDLLALNTQGNNVAFFSIGSDGIPVYKDALEVFPSRNEIIYPLFANGNYLYCGTQNKRDSDKNYGTIGIVKLPRSKGDPLDKGTTCYDALLDLKLIPNKSNAAEYNTAALNTWLKKISSGHEEFGKRSLHFGAGSWYFNDTIEVKSGQCSSIFSDAIPTMSNMPCRLIFADLPVHKTAMRLTSCSPQNIAVLGNEGLSQSNKYYFYITRDKLPTGETVMVEKGAELLLDNGSADSRSHDDFITNYKANLGTRSIGIELMEGTCLPSHVVIKYFYTGIWTHPGNMELRDIQPCGCHYGIVNQSDTQVVNCRPYQCHTGWVINGPLIHGIGYRTDTVYTSVWATNGRWTIESLDADWCLGPALRLSGNANRPIDSFTINGFTARCCVVNSVTVPEVTTSTGKRLYEFGTDPDTLLDNTHFNAAAVTDAANDALGWIVVEPGAVVRGGLVTFTMVNTHAYMDNKPYRDKIPPQNELYIKQGAYVEMQMNVGNPNWRGIAAEDIAKYHIRNDNTSKAVNGSYGRVMVNSPYDKLRLIYQAAGALSMASAFEAGGLNPAPENWPQWTAQQQAAIREKIGILSVEGVGF